MRLGKYGTTVISEVIKQYQKFKLVPATKNICYHILNRERRKSFGSANPDKTFYIIRSVDIKSPFYIGAIPCLLANYFLVISHLKYAKDNGWVPIIDQINYPVYNSVCGEINGTRNAWEYFWQQPTDCTLEDAYKSRNVILSRRSWLTQWTIDYDAENYTNKELIGFYHELSKTIPLNKEISDHVNTAYEDLFKPEDRVLGVSFRFGGYAKESQYSAPGHPISPDIEKLIELVSEKFRQWSMSRIFLASDEESSVEKFKAAFGENLSVIPRKRTDPTKIYSNKDVDPMYATENLHDTTLSYLTEMEILSKCTGLIGSVSGGLRYAVVRNNCAYEHAEIIDCGRFEDKNRRGS